MYRIIEAVKQDGKETQSWYSFETEAEARVEYETKLGANMKTDIYSASLLALVDNVGNVICNKKIGEDALSPRLMEVKATSKEETSLTKYDTDNLVEANFHSKWGAAIKNSSVQSEMLLGFDGEGNAIVSTYWVRN